MGSKGSKSGGGGGGGSAPSSTNPCPLALGKAMLNKTLIPNWVQCEVKHYAPKGQAYVQKLTIELQNMADTLLQKVQSNVSADLTRVEGDLQTVEQYLRTFLHNALISLDEELPKLEKMANVLLQDALNELDAWIDREVDNLIHSLAPLLAWIVALLLSYQIYGGVFDTLPVAYRLAIASLVVITVPPSLRSKFDFLAAPTALSLFVYILLRAKRAPKK